MELERTLLGDLTGHGPDPDRTSQSVLELQDDVIETLRLLDPHGGTFLLRTKKENHLIDPYRVSDGSHYKTCFLRELLGELTGGDRLDHFIGGKLGIFRVTGILRLTVHKI